MFFLSSSVHVIFVVLVLVVVVKVVVALMIFLLIACAILYLICLNFLELSCDSLLTVVLHRFERFCSVFIAKNLIPNLPSLRPSVFKKEFPMYMDNEEYQHFIDEIREVSENYRMKLV